MTCDGFYRKYGHWPSRLLLRDPVITDVRRLFSQKDWETINAKVRVAPVEEARATDYCFIAEDDHGGTCRYGEEPSQRPDTTGNEPTMMAREWFGVETLFS
jgi:hypothetical protein